MDGREEKERGGRLVEVPPRRTDIEACTLVGDAPRLLDVRGSAPEERLQSIAAIGNRLAIHLDDVTETHPAGRIVGFEERELCQQLAISRSPAGAF